MKLESSHCLHISANCLQQFASPPWLASLHHGYQTDGNSGCLNAKYPGGGQLGRRKNTTTPKHTFHLRGSKHAGETQPAVPSCPPFSYHSTAPGQCGVREIPSDWSRFRLCLWRPVAFCCLVCFQTCWYLFFCFLNGIVCQLAVSFQARPFVRFSPFNTIIIIINGGSTSLKGIGVLTVAEDRYKLWLLGSSPPPPPPAFNIENTQKKSPSVGLQDDTLLCFNSSGFMGPLNSIASY